jgi:hypothetical protein
VEDSVSTLLLIAADEEHLLVFEDTLLKQVAQLRKELDKEDGLGNATPISHIRQVIMEGKRFA